MSIYTPEEIQDAIFALDEEILKSTFRNTTAFGHYTFAPKTKEEREWFRTSPLFEVGLFGYKPTSLTTHAFLLFENHYWGLCKYKIDTNVKAEDMELFRHPHVMKLLNHVRFNNNCTYPVELLGEDKDSNGKMYPVPTYSHNAVLTNKGAVKCFMGGACLTPLGKHLYLKFKKEGLL